MLKGLSSVLLPSDDTSWVLNFVDGYRELGFEVITGTLNFTIEASNPDLIHLNWPEELTGWKCPSERELEELEARLARWARRARIIVSVDNLYPHVSGDREVWRRLYLSVYSAADVIHHFSHTSCDIVRREFPEIAGRKHVVRTGFNYERLLCYKKKDRDAARAEYGFSTNDFVLLSFGSLRYWSEVDLLRRSFSNARASRKKLLMASKYGGEDSIWRQRQRRLLLKLWRCRGDIISIRRYVEDAEVPSLFAAADALVVVRRDLFGSGLPSLAMTLATPVIAPLAGVIPEYLAGTENILYDPTSFRSLAAAIDKMAGIDREKLAVENSKRAAQWGWKDTISTCLAGL